MPSLPSPAYPTSRRSRLAWRTSRSPRVGWGCRTWPGWPRPPSPPALLLPPPPSPRPTAPSLSARPPRISLTPLFARWNCLRTEVCRAPPSPSCRPWPRRATRPASWPRLRRPSRQAAVPTSSSSRGRRASQLWTSLSGPGRPTTLPRTAGPTSLPPLKQTRSGPTARPSSPER